MDFVIVIAGLFLLKALNEYLSRVEGRIAKARYCNAKRKRLEALRDQLYR